MNGVGVELNTASAPLLSRVAGIGATRGQADRGAPQRARRVQDAQGAARGDRRGPEDVRAGRRLPARARRRAPARRSAVHPERYELVERMANDLGVPVASVVGNAELLRRIDLAKYRQGDVGDFTLDDILAELDEARSRSAQDLRAAEVSRRRAHARRSEAGHGARGRGHQRDRVRRVRRRRRPSGRPGARLAARRSLRQGSAATW